ncbi:hypothetical protein FB45DRAFT_1053744 [Roridomyces roridus]|uniref:F-box domain-containing protein n=1 Tax=Roridomyces roridus TaxID=1738132 RepID=A0AAD7FVZ0_9AGAR|nr:hypothetical protein FB45DRAFT_1053744 [Roridomyces roridus]
MPRFTALQLEQESRQQRLDAYTYPVLTLPNEITSEIFVLVLPPYPYRSKLTGLSSPTSLTHICGKWRDIALATPRLWRAFSTVFKADQPEHILAVQTWLERSGSCPLSIHLAVGDQVPNEVLVAILLHRERWQHMELELAASELGLVKGPMPLLEILTLAVETGDHTTPATDVNSFPRLRAVTVHNTCGVKLNWLPMFQLTSLTFVDMVSSNDYLPLLQDALNLVSLHLIACNTNVPLQSGVKLDRLEKLVIFNCWCPEDAATPIFETFTLPALRTLLVSGELLGPGNPTASLIPLVTRSGCELQQIIIVPGSRSRNASFIIRALREVFPSIANFIFSDSKYDWYRDTF